MITDVAQDLHEDIVTQMNYDRNTPIMPQLCDVEIIEVVLNP